MRIGTRGSALALAQTQFVARLLGGAEVVTIATSGEARGARYSDKSRWVLELERALSAREIDLAVHSAKDVPGELADGLALLGAPPRAAAEDVLCGGSGPEQLAPGARVGTSSLRRAAQLRALREDLEVVPVRGNVDTRLRKLGEGDLDALVLARAGLVRLGREAEAGAVLDPARFVPSPGQGTLALEGRADDERTPGGRAGDHRRQDVRLPASRARRGARARRELPHPARGARGRLRLRLPAPARAGSASRTARRGWATSCSAASTTPTRSGAAWPSGLPSAGGRWSCCEPARRARWRGPVEQNAEP